MRLELPCGSPLEPIIETICHAGKLLRDSQRDPRQIEKKGFRDLVGDADLRSERHILERLSELHRGDEILAEESGGCFPKTGRCWIVDPLDGTTNYSHRHPLYSVSAALWQGGRPVAAVTHSPVLGQTWFAVEGGGAWCRESDGRTERLQLASGDQLEECLLATGFSYQRKELEAGALQLFESLLRQAREVRRGGSACLDLAFTAAGIFQGFWEFHLAPHDMAAGALLVREAGGVVTDGLGGDEWLFGDSIVAASASLHPILLEQIGSHYCQDSSDGSSS